MINYWYNIIKYDIYKKNHIKSHKINYFKKIMLALLCDLAYNKSYNYDTGNYIGLLVIKITYLFAHGCAKF